MISSRTQTSQADEPSNILWENLECSYMNRCVRSLISMCVSFLIIVIAIAGKPTPKPKTSWLRSDCCLQFDVVLTTTRAPGNTFEPESDLFRHLVIYV